MFSIPLFRGGAQRISIWARCADGIHQRISMFEPSVDGFFPASHFTAIIWPQGTEWIIKSKHVKLSLFLRWQGCPKHNANSLQKLHFRLKAYVLLLTFLLPWYISLFRPFSFFYGREIAFEALGRLLLVTSKVRNQWHELSPRLFENGDFCMRKRACK